MTTPASAEPTADDLSVAMQLITANSTHGGDARIDFADAIARALAAAVTAEREKLRQAALDFDRRSDRSVGDRSAAFAEAAARLHFLAGDPA